MSRRGARMVIGIVAILWGVLGILGGLASAYHGSVSITVGQGGSGGLADILAVFQALEEGSQVALAGA